MKYEIKGITPGCFVERKVRTGGAEEARVLAIRGNDAILVDYSNQVSIAPLKECKLKYAVVGNAVYNRFGKFIRKFQ